VPARKQQQAALPIDLMETYLGERQLKKEKFKATSSQNFSQLGWLNT
jgi:hypothetical protein